MRQPIIILIIEDHREFSIGIATLLREIFNIECVIIQNNEEQPESGIENCIGQMSRLDLLQALLNESSNCTIPSSFDLIIRNTRMPDSIAISQPYRVPPRKFAEVRKISIPAQCKSSRIKVRNRSYVILNPK